jgi:hypothetical protein
MLKSKMSQALLLVACIGTGLGCNSLPADESEIEQSAVKQPPPPTSAPPGSLGGICGKDYRQCPTGQAMVDKFRKLKRTGVSDKCVSVSETGTKSVSVKMKVPRLVNDHNLSSDLLEMRLSEDASPGIVSSSLTFLRNQTAVAFVAGNNSDGVFTPVVDMSLGGAETLLAFATTKTSVDKLDTGTEKCVVKFGDSCGFPFDEGCASCTIHKSLLAGALFVVTSQLALMFKASEEAALSIGAGAAAGGEFTKSLVSCDQTCKRGDCNQKVCSCLDEVERTGGGSKDASRCNEMAERCCMSAGGMCSSGINGRQSCITCVGAF